ncbi:TonB family protein [Sedimentitalea sp. JM2-8]|uniref:TonB family protein n=1 Tax=Sedimentitalea xiamensis TaxID=3050037 RepID=A0ABT7FI43_9RHOB|nr:TonB family protein [Sedimentitalea xiamensis]MDK3074459.1 TonB family protein [Sedimentitalea xiamensis]
MRKPVEILLFGTLAICLHILLMAEGPDRGAEAGGVGGAALVTLAGATPQIETMVASWVRPPAAAQQIVTEQPEMQNPNERSPVTSVRIEDAPKASIKLAAMQPPETETPRPPELSTAPPPSPAAEAKPSAQPVPNLRPRAKPAKRQQEASAGTAPQKSAGSGGSANAGNRGSADTSILSGGQEARLIAVWGSRIRSHIERKKRYPAGTRAKGDVTLKMSVDRTGRLQAVSVRRSSGDAKLDAAAVAAVQRAGRFPSAPKELPGSVFSFSLAINFDS